MKRLLNSRPVNQALRGASLVVTDRRWAAPLSAAALGFGIFAGVAIGPGTAGTLATGAQQIIQIPGSGGGDEPSGGGGPIASTATTPALEGSEGGGFEEAIPPSVPLAPEPVEPPPSPTPEPAAKPAPADVEEDEEPEGQAFEGTVVQTNPAAGSYAMAIKGDELVSVHASKLPEPGAKLSTSLTALANGTFAEAGAPEVEQRKDTEATFSGTVTYANPDPVSPAYTVSGRGASLLVHVDPDPSGALPSLPAIGSLVRVTATIEESADPEGDPSLVQSKAKVEDVPPSTYLELAGIVKEVLPDGHLLFSADDSGKSEADLTLTVPGAVDPTKLKPGDSYLATAELEPDGSLKLTGIASDEHTKGAGDPASAQGDLKRPGANASSAGGGEVGVSGGARRPFFALDPSE